MKNTRLLFVVTLMMAASSSWAQEVFTGKVYKLPRPTALQLRSNTLYLAGGIFNIGVELQSNSGLAVQVDYLGAWWNSPSRARFYSCYGLQTELRYYLESRKLYPPYLRHHFGIYGQILSYDFEFGGRGYQSRDVDMTVGAGVSYGYTFPLSRRWSLDLTGGIGYFQSRYDVYDPDFRGNFIRKDVRKLKTVAPTKLEATLVYNINYKNDKKR